MNKKIKAITPFQITVILFIISVIIRYELSDFLKKIYVYADELRYFSIAENLFKGNGVMIYNQPWDFQKILYSMVIMPAFAFASRVTQIKAICFINAFIMSSGIFPVYLMAKNILENRRDIVLMSLLYITLSDLAYTMTFMSEVVFMPLALWGLYCFYRLFISREKREMYRLSVIIGGLVFLLYLNKEIALSFLMAYMIFVFETAIISSKREKKGFRQIIKEPSVRSLVIMGGFFCLLFAIMKLTVFKGMGNSYNQMGIGAVASWFRLAYMLYGFFYLLLCVSIAYFYFPILIPVINIKNMRDDRKRFFAFLMLVLLVSVGVIAYTITVREDLGREVPRIHLRYICYLFIPIFMVFWAELKTSALTIQKRTLVIACFLFSAIVWFVFKGVLNASSVDETALKYISALYNQGFLFEVSVLKVCLCLVVFFETYLLCKNKKFYLFMTLVTVFMVNGVNNYTAINEYASNYKLQTQDYKEVEELRLFISSKSDENFLILSDRLEDDQRILDTYVEGNNVFTASIEQFNEANNAGIEYINEMDIYPLLGKTPYKTLERIDYIIISNVAGDHIKLTSPEIELKGTNRFRVYQNVDNRKIPRCAGNHSEIF